MNNEAISAFLQAHEAGVWVFIAGWSLLLILSFGLSDTETRQ